MKHLMTLLKLGFSKIVKLVSSPAFQSASQLALTVVSGLQAIAPNKTLGEVLKAYEEYGVPVTAALADGKLDPEETKAALGFLASKVVQRAFPSMSTTQANILVNVAYEQIK